MRLNTEEFINKIKSRSIKITVVGLGKMGLPIATVFTHAGYSVTGYDISDSLVNQLNIGQTNLSGEPGVPERLKTAVENGKFKATTNVSIAFNEAEIVIVIIPILDTESGAQDLDTLKEVYHKIVLNCKRDTLFIQESTLAPMTSKNELWPLLENKSKESGTKFGLVFAPERTLSGRAIQDIEENYPKIVGGIHVEDTIIASNLYKTVVKKGVIELSDATTAEAVKTFKGAYRDANIAIANQFAIMADLYGIDVLEVIDAANTEPYSHIHRPGIGVGGHCIPVYPKFLIHSSSQLGYSANLLTNSRIANDYMVDYAISTIEKENINRESILILGLAYRNGVKEYRNSPTLRLVPKLREIGFKVGVMDPLYNAEEIDHLFGTGSGVEYNPENFIKFDTIIVATDHEDFKNLNHELENKTIFDGRYVINRKIKNSKVIQPGRLVKNSEK